MPVAIIEIQGAVRPERRMVPREEPSAPSPSNDRVPQTFRQALLHPGVGVESLTKLAKPGDSAMATVSETTVPWEEHDLPVDDLCRWSLGPLRLFCLRTRNELRVAFEYAPGDREHEEASTPPVDELPWSRWAIERQSWKIRFSPVLPNLPVVMRPERPFHVTRGSQARIYIRIPIWLRLELVTEAAVTLTEIPTVVLSKTWFGTFTEGDLCYWLAIKARRELSGDLFRPHLAMCPLLVINASPTETLNVEKLSMHVEQLSIYRQDGRWWADESRVVYAGEEKFSRIDVGREPPREAPGARLVTPPRLPGRKTFVGKTFQALKTLPGLGV